MALQLFALKEKDALKEFRQALISGETGPVIERHDDVMLLALLRHRRSPLRNIFWGVSITLFLLLVVAFQLWFAGQILIFFSGITWSHIEQKDSKRKSKNAWWTIRQRVEAASLPTLLMAHRLKIPELSSAIQEGMIKRLTLATEEDLHNLTILERQELVRFTLRQLRPQWVGYPVLDAAQRQAATLGYLALATLKLPGAERPNRTGMNATHTHLSKAIEEYLSVIRTKAE